MSLYSRKSTINVKYRINKYVNLGEILLADSITRWRFEIMKKRQDTCVFNRDVKYISEYIITFLYVFRISVHSHPSCKFISLLFPNYSRYVSGSPDVFSPCEKVQTGPPTAALCIISPRSGYAPAKLSQLSGDSVHRSRGRSMPDAIFEFGFRLRTRTTYAMCTCACVEPRIIPKLQDARRHRPPGPASMLHEHA